MVVQASPGRQVHILPLILVTTAIRLAFAAALGLGVDESYMVAAGRTLSLGYFDHPPASWWLSWAAAHLLGTEAPIVVRLPFIALFALSTWLTFRLGTRIADARAGFWAAVLLNLSPVFGVTTGTWVLPDGPLDCALLGAALCLVRALDVGERGALRWWCGAGLCAGLALFSKYSAVLTIAGALLYFAISARHRRWLRRPEPYVAALLACAVFAPVIVWNATHGWASFAFQGDRATGLRFHPLAPLATLAGEALFVLPWIWLPMMAVFVVSFRRGAPWPDRLLGCLAAPPIVLFALVSAWSSQRVLFHWAAPGYLMLFPLLGREVARRLQDAWVRRTLFCTACLVVAVLTVIGTQIRLDWLGPSLATILHKDPTIEGVDWASLRASLDSQGLLRPGTVVGVPNWRDAGKIAYALGPSVPVICLNRDSRQFGFADPAAARIGQDVLLLAVDHPERVTAALAPRFARIEPVGSAPVELDGRRLADVTVMRGQRLLSWPWR
jgi:4-amino-4-deoxy-L-arabinose transferase-like glycosyltransferase